MTTPPDKSLTKWCPVCKGEVPYKVKRNQRGITYICAKCGTELGGSIKPEELWG